MYACCETHPAHLSIVSKPNYAIFIFSFEVVSVDILRHSGGCFMAGPNVVSPIKKM